MNKQERYERGARLINDAHFVRDVFLRVGLDAEKWNIVVFEAYRASELLTKGIIYSIGYEFEEHHRLHDLLARLTTILENEKQPLPFIYRAVEPSGNSYEVFIEGDALGLLCQTDGVYSQLGSSGRVQNPYAPTRLVRRGSTISVWQDDKELMVGIDSTLLEDLAYEKIIPALPDQLRIESLKTLVEILLRTREDAFYSQRQFTKEEAEAAIENVAKVFELSKAFWISERV